MTERGDWELERASLRAALVRIRDDKLSGSDRLREIAKRALLLHDRRLSKQRKESK